MSYNRDFDLSRTISPPSYTVYEDKRGNLVNKELNLVWPKRPQTGRYSLDTYVQRKKAAKARKPPVQSESDGEMATDYKDSSVVQERSQEKRAQRSRRSEREERGRDGEKSESKRRASEKMDDSMGLKDVVLPESDSLFRFIGAADPQRAVRKTRGGRVSVFYLKTSEDVQTELHLAIAFPSQHRVFQVNKVMAAPGKALWYMDKRSNGPLFSSLQELIIFFARFPETLNAL